MPADASSPQTSGFAPSAAGLGRSAGDPSYGDGRFRPPDPARQSPVLGRCAEQSKRDPGPFETTRLLREQAGSQAVSPRTTHPKQSPEAQARDDSWWREHPAPAVWKPSLGLQCDTLQHHALPSETVQPQSNHQRIRASQEIGGARAPPINTSPTSTKEGPASVDASAQQQQQQQQRQQQQRDAIAQVRLRCEFTEELEAHRAKYKAKQSWAEQTDEAPAPQRFPIRGDELFGSPANQQRMQANRAYETVEERLLKLRGGAEGAKAKAPGHKAKAPRPWQAKVQTEAAHH